MCIIAVTKDPNLLTKTTLENCWDNNNHGAGFAYVSHKQIKVIKELASFKRFWHLFNKHREEALSEGSPIVLHFRIASHGSISIGNIHPFFVNRDLIMAHNGILPIKEDGKKSDTRTFCDSVLKQFPKGFETNQAYTFLIEGWMGKGSKIVFLNSKKELVILNREAWVNEEKLKTLFSNHSFSYKSARNTTTAGFGYTRNDHTYPFRDGKTVVGVKPASENKALAKTEPLDKALNDLIITNLIDRCHMCSASINLKQETLYRVVLCDEPNKTVLCEKCYQTLTDANLDVTLVDIETGIIETGAAL